MLLYSRPWAWALLLVVAMFNTKPGHVKYHTGGLRRPPVW